MVEGGEELRVEATGETVGEAKWSALRELERRSPSVDKTTVQFEVLSEGSRGLLGVGYAPARVAATATVTAGAAEPLGAEERREESDAQASLRELLTRVTAALGVRCAISIEEDAESIRATLSGPDLGYVIGRHGQTIDAIQALASAILTRVDPEERKDVVVDAAGYRARREATLERLATEAAERALARDEPVELEPMTAVERRIVHQRLQDRAGITTSSEGSEPNRYVVVRPAPAGGAVRVEPAEGDAGPAG